MGLFGRDLAIPLERRLSLRHEQRARDGDLHAAARLGRRSLFRAVVRALGKARDALDVVIGLGRKANHEIKLAATPTSGKCRVNSAKQVFLAHALINNVAQPLRAGFRRKRQAAALSARNQLGHFNAKRIQALAGNRYRNALSIEAAIQATQNFLDLAMVGRRKRRKAHFVVASFGKSALNSGNDIIGRTLAHGTIHHARLTETASTRATA